MDPRPWTIDDDYDQVRSGRRHLIYTRTGNRQTPDHLGRRLRNLLPVLDREGKIANAEEVNIHTLRKTYISHMIMAGVEPVKVMAIVGHQE